MQYSISTVLASVIGFCFISASGCLIRVEGKDDVQPAVGQEIWPSGYSKVDADGDGISDEYEEYLGNRFKPVFHPDGPDSMRPGSVEYFISHCNDFKSVDDAMAWVKDDPRSGVRLSPRAPFDPEHGDRCIADDNDWKDKRPTVFFRVTRFGADKEVFAPCPPPHEYVHLQYFYFCYFSDADVPANQGDHDGDWCGVDLLLIVKAPENSKAAAASYKEPVVDSAIFHQHGRQAYVDELRHRKLSLPDNHLQIYMEGNSNEPWPNAHGGGFGGWPVRPGFLVNYRFERCQGAYSPSQECHIVRDHNGKGPPISDYRLLNLGERDKPGDDKLVKFVMRFAGHYGRKAVGFPGIYENEPPKGPAFQPAFWDRDFSKGNFDHYSELKVPDSDAIEDHAKLDRNSQCP